MKKISKLYNSGVLANDAVSLDLAEGEILAIVGENGAGKTTIMKILYGLEQPTGGKIIINGQACTFKNPQDAMARGIGMVQQNFMLLPPFSIAENVVYGSEPRSLRLFFDRKKAEKEVRELGERFGLKAEPNLLIKDCSVGLQQRCEILKVLYQNANIIIFDEPSAVLTPQEVDGLLSTIRSLAKMGKSIILITHKLNEVMAVADRCVVMRGGRLIDTVKTSDASTQELSAMMIGRKLTDKSIPEVKKGAAVLSIEHLYQTGKDGRQALRDCSLTVHAGEIVGIAGVSGNGQTELLHTVAGLSKDNTNGSITLGRQNLLGLTVRQVREAGCAYVPEDRNTMGAALQANLTETTLMGRQYEGGYSENGIIQFKKANQQFNTLLNRYDVKYSSLNQRAGELSGGNLQKLIVAREISRNAKLLIVAEPTRGVDIGAMEFIHNQIIEQRSAGAAILLVSSDLNEILKLSDRIYVMYGGGINGELPRAEASAENVGILMTGGGLRDKVS